VVLSRSTMHASLARGFYSQQFTLHITGNGTHKTKQENHIRWFIALCFLHVKIKIYSQCDFDFG